MTIDKPTSAGLRLLRVANGLYLLTHGLLKVIYYPPAGTMAFFEKIGLPGKMALLVMLCETTFGLLLVAGIWVRWAAAGAVVILLGAVAFHSGNGFVFSNPGGGWEYPLFWAIALAALALIAPDERALKQSA